MNHARHRSAARRASGALAAITAVVVLAACGGGGSTDAGTDDGGGDAAVEDAASGPSVTMNLGHVFPDGSELDLAADAFAEDVAERTGGTVTVNVFPGGQLGGDEEMATALSSGTQEAAVLSVGSTGFGDRVQLQNLPYLVDDFEAADQMFYGDGFMAEWDRETMSQNGIVALEFMENGFRGLSNSTRAVELPEDVAGLKVRAPSSDLIIEIFAGWDAQAVAIPFPELYTALEQGTVDGQENGVTLFYDSKLYEVQEFYTDTRYTYASAAFTVSQTTWDTLNSGQQEVLQSAAEAASEAQREAVRANADAAIADLQDQIDVTILTDEQIEVWRESVQPIYDDAEETFGADVIADLRAAADEANGA